MPGICGNDGLCREVGSPFLKDSHPSPHRLTPVGPDTTFFRAPDALSESALDRSAQRFFLPPLLSGQTEHTIGARVSSKICSHGRESGRGRGPHGRCGAKSNRKPRGGSMNGAKLYVGNLSYSVTDEQLKELFSEYGEVKQANVIEGKGFGFVEMSAAEDAEKARKALNGSDFKGRALRDRRSPAPKSRDRVGLREQVLKRPAHVNRIRGG